MSYFFNKYSLLLYVFTRGVLGSSLGFGLWAKTLWGQKYLGLLSYLSIRVSDVRVKLFSIIHKALIIRFDDATFNSHRPSSDDIITSHHAYSYSSLLTLLYSIWYLHITRQFSEFLKEKWHELPFLPQRQELKKKAKIFQVESWKTKCAQSGGFSYGGNRNTLGRKNFFGWSQRSKGMVWVAQNNWLSIMISISVKQSGVFTDGKSWRSWNF